MNCFIFYNKNLDGSFRYKIILKANGRFNKL